MNDTRKLDVLCVGMSVNWINEWLKREDIRLVGCVDLYGKGAGEGELPVYPTLKEALRHHKPDLVTLTAPPDGKTAPADVESILRSGYDVYIEKLRPSSLEDGAALLRLAEQYDRGIAVGESYRYEAVIQTVKRLMDGGKLGRIEQIVWNCHRVNIEDAWTDAYPHVMLEDLSYHHLGAIQYLAGTPLTEVYASTRAPSWSHKPHTEVSLMMRGGDHLRVSYFASWAASGELTPWLGDFRLEGTQGTVIAQNGDIRYRARSESEDEPSARIEIGPHEHVLMGGIIDEYIRSFRSGHRSDQDIRQTVGVIELMRGALQSSIENRVVTIGGPYGTGN